jgi:hypothetical protein
MKDLLIACSDGLTVEKAFVSVFNDFGLDYEKLQSEWMASVWFFYNKTAP